MVIICLIVAALITIKVIWVVSATIGHGSFEVNEKRLSVGQTISPQWSALLHRIYSTKYQVVLVSSSKVSGLYTHAP